MAKKSKKQDDSKIIMSCHECEHCEYVGEGDYVCDQDYSIVLTDWNTPTEDYLHCEGEDFVPLPLERF